MVRRMNRDPRDDGLTREPGRRAIREVRELAPDSPADQRHGPPTDPTKRARGRGRRAAIRDVVVEYRAPVGGVGDLLLVRPRAPLMPRFVGPATRPGHGERVGRLQWKETHGFLWREVVLDRG